MLRACLASLPQLTWGEADLGDDVLAVVEGDQVLQGVSVDDDEAAIVQAHRQRLAVRRETTAASPYREGAAHFSQVTKLRASPALRIKLLL